MPALKMNQGTVIGSFSSPVHNSELHSGDVLYPVHEYSYHLGSTNGVITNTSTGLGAAGTTGHVATVSTGAGIGTCKHIMNLTNGITLGAKPVTASFLVDLIQNGTGVDRHTFVGLSEDHVVVPGSGTHCIGFWQQNDNTWKCYTEGAVPQGSSAVTIVNGDILSIVATSGEGRWYVNGTLVYSIKSTLVMPTNAVKPGAGVIGTAATVTLARICGIDWFAFRQVK